jgi:hypothetical protein
MRDRSHKKSHLKYLILDCRKESQYKYGRLALAQHMDPKLLARGQEEELQKRIDEILNFYVKEFGDDLRVCLFDGGGISMSRECEEFIHKLQEVCTIHYFLSVYFTLHTFNDTCSNFSCTCTWQACLAHVGFFEGGYAALHAMWKENAHFNIIDHDDNECIECNLSKGRSRRSWRKFGASKTDPDGDWDANVSADVAEKASKLKRYYLTLLCV